MLKIETMYQKFVTVFLRLYVLVLSFITCSLYADDKLVFVSASPSSWRSLEKYPVNLYCSNDEELIKVNSIMDASEQVFKLIFVDKMRTGIILSIIPSRVTATIFDMDSLQVSGSFNIPSCDGCGYGETHLSINEKVILWTRVSDRNNDTTLFYEHDLQEKNQEDTTLSKELKVGKISDTVLAGYPALGRVDSFTSIVQDQGEAYKYFAGDIRLSLGWRVPENLAKGRGTFALPINNSEYAVTVPFSNVPDGTPEETFVLDKLLNEWSVIDTEPGIISKLFNTKLVYSYGERYEEFIACEENKDFESFCLRNQLYTYLPTGEHLIYDMKNKTKTIIQQEERDSEVLTIIDDKIIWRLGTKIGYSEYTDPDNFTLLIDDPIVEGFHWAYMADSDQVASCATVNQLISIHD